MGKRELTNWWEPQPMTEEQMKVEIAMSNIKPKSAASEFTEKDVKDTLKALNLGNKYVSPAIE